MSEADVVGPFAHRSELSAGEGGLAGTVFEEAGHAGRGVVRAENLDERSAFERQAVSDRHVAAVVDRALAECLRHPGARRHLGGKCESRVR